MKKIVVGFFLIVSLLFIGFICGGTIAKYFFVKSGDGLAGGATVAMLGFLGAGIGLVTAIVLMRKLEAKTKLILTLILTVVSIFFLERFSL